MVSFIQKFDDNYLKSDDNNDIILFDELINLFNISRKELINNLKLYKIKYNAFLKKDNKTGGIYGYIKKEQIHKNITPNIDYTQNIIYPDNILNNIDDIIKYSPIMIQYYKVKLQKYDYLIKLTNTQKEKQELYNSLLLNTKLITKTEKSIDKRLIPLTNIIFKLYKPLYYKYQNELENINYENIKDDYILSQYYRKYIILKNQHHQTEQMKESLKSITKYLNENYEQVIINKKIKNQQEVLDTINILDISQNEINTPSLDLLI